MIALANRLIFVSACVVVPLLTAMWIAPMARPVLEHRLILRPESQIEGVTAGEVIQEILQKVPVPR